MVKHFRAHSPVIITLFSIAMLLFYPLVVRDVFFHIPAYTATYDCDDATLLMFNKLSALRFTVTPILGNLEMTGEKYAESNHLWLLANIAGRPVAFDWGVQYLDRQHYEGYLLTYNQLIGFVQQDKEKLPILGFTSVRSSLP
jgi:hypothetical protein